MKYSENNRLGDIISEHYQLLLVLSRFEIPLGFGDKTVQTVCQENNVNCKTFLAVVNYVATGDSTLYREVDIESMISFLRLAHEYYLSFMLPDLRKNLVYVTDRIEDKKLSELVLKLFDNYVSEVQTHLAYEDNILFNYTRQLLDNSVPDDNFRIASFIRQHDNIESSLGELKTVIIKYFPADGILREVNQVLYRIFSCEEDLNAHCEIEDNLFMPAVVELERNYSLNRKEA